MTDCILEPGALLLSLRSGLEESRPMQLDPLATPRLLLNVAWHLACIAVYTALL